MRELGFTGGDTQDIHTLKILWWPLVKASSATASR